MTRPTFSEQRLFIQLCNRPQKASCRGFSLLEMLIASLMAGVFILICLGLFVEQRRQFLTEQAKTEINQNLRIAMDLIGADIRQAGERLETDTELAKLSIIDGGTTSADTLITQRKLLNETIPVCQTINAGSSTTVLDVAITGNPTVTNCLFSDGDGDGLTDNLNQLQNHRTSQDNIAGSTRTVNTTSCAIASGIDAECVFAYIHDPTSNRGEFFVYGFEDSGPCTGTNGRTCNRLYRSDGVRWQNTYTYNANGTPSNQPRIYILEEREYSLVPDTNTSRTDDYILQLRINRQNSVRLANKISNFSVTGADRGGNTLNSFNYINNLPQHRNSLRDTQYFRVALTIVSPDAAVSVSNRTLSSQFFPRNALSW